MSNKNESQLWQPAICDGRLNVKFPVIYFLQSDEKDQRNFRRRVIKPKEKSQKDEIAMPIWDNSLSADDKVIILGLIWTKFLCFGQAARPNGVVKENVLGV